MVIISKEHRLACFDDIDKLFSQLMTMFVALNDPQTTTKQKEAITEAQTQLLAFENKVIGKLKRKML